MKEEMKEEIVIVIDLRGKCESCKERFDISLLHELYGEKYEPGRCPLCGGYLI